MSAHISRGLDAAGKTTICKKLLGEPIDGVSPTLGFIIKTIEYDGLVPDRTFPLYAHIYAQAQQH
jgi:hypothetical protein